MGETARVEIQGSDVHFHYLSETSFVRKTTVSSDEIFVGTRQNLRELACFSAACSTRKLLFCNFGDHLELFSALIANNEESLLC